MGNMDKQDFAKVVNDSIKSINKNLKESDLENLIKNLEEALDLYAPSADIAADFLIGAYTKTFNDMLEVKGFPVRSIKTIDGENTSELKGIGMENIFNDIEENIRLIYLRLVSEVKENAIKERNSQIKERINDFLEWSKLKGDARKEAVSDIRSTLKSIYKWDKIFYSDYALDLIREVEIIANIKNGAIAVKWSYGSPYSEEFDCKHKLLDNKYFFFRTSKEIKDGLIDLSNINYFDDAPRPREEWGCLCRFVFLYTINDIPESLLSKKAKTILSEQRTNFENALKLMEKGNKTQKALAKSYRELKINNEKSKINIDSKNSFLDKIIHYFFNPFKKH